MQIWLKSGRSTVRLPVLPGAYEVTDKQNNTVLNVVDLGEISIFGKRGLQEVKFSCFFPAHYDTYCEFTNIRKPSYYVKKIQGMKESGPIKLIITGANLKTQYTIESFTWGESDGTGDINYSIDFKEYRFPNIPKSKVVKKAPAAPKAAQRPAPAKKAARTYTVKKGDCLCAIAKRLTGSSNWRAIYNQNKSVIGRNPNLIYPGQVLTIP